MAGLNKSSILAPKNTTPTPLQNAYTNYGTAVKRQGQDYDELMNKYNQTFNSIPGVGSGASQTFDYNYTKPTYQTTQDYTRAVGNVRSASDNGLYSGQDQSDIRERGISPIRSVYANAQRNLNRQRSLQGGYSPNYAAVSAKMAREMSSQLSDQTTKVNAQLAQDIAGQRAKAQSEYLGAASGEQNARNQFELNSAEMNNKYGLDKLNSQMEDYWAPTKMKLSALGGATGLYGTTPGFAALMQNGALQQGAQEANVNQNNAVNQQRLMQIYGGQ